MRFASERYPTAYRTTIEGTQFLYCGRDRCWEKLYLIINSDGSRVLDRVIAVTDNNGETVEYFCSTRCASLTLKRL